MPTTKTPQGTVTLLALNAYERCVFALEKVLDKETPAENRPFFVAMYDRNFGLIEALRNDYDDTLLTNRKPVDGVDFIDLPADFDPVFEDARRDLIVAHKRLGEYNAVRDNEELDRTKEARLARGAVSCVRARASMLAGYKDVILK